MGSECLLEAWDQCCCECKWRLTDYWHCDTMPEEFKPPKGEGCGCSVVKGYICTNPEIYEERSGGRGGGSSGWSQHGVCECFDRWDDPRIASWEELQTQLSTATKRIQKLEGGLQSTIGYTQEVMDADPYEPIKVVGIGIIGVCLEALKRGE